MAFEPGTFALGTGIRDTLGLLGGALLAPLVASVSALRRARLFHPSGICVRAEVRAIDRDPLGERLAGPALARLSSAWWKDAEWHDVLGIALRFTGGGALGPRAREGDQDLLFATIRRPWTMALAPFSTDHRDFLANHYFAVSPFRAPGLEGEIEFRLVPARTVRDGATRRERLGRAMARHDAVLVLHVRRYRRAIAPRAEPWRPIARIELRSVVTLDQDALRFDPFRDGRGIRPVGLVHALRVGTYAASQQARPRGCQRATARDHRANGQRRGPVAS